jgi:aromatic-amino-acid transaminase
VHDRELSRDYLPVTGEAAFIDAIESLLCGEQHEKIAPRIRTAHTPGGTAALWIGATLLRSTHPNSAIWVSDPTWGNHIKVFEQAGHTVRSFPWHADQTRRLNFGSIQAAIQGIPEHDVVFLQASTHNPTGLDPALEQWRELRGIIRRRNLVPFVDVAFFGFAEGLREDLAGLSLLLEDGGDLLVATSLSKSMSFYNERVGSLSVVGSTAHAAENAFSYVEHLIRGSYSNPPLHGAAIAAEVLRDAELRAMWEQELAAIRSRIASMRERLVTRLHELAPEQELGHISTERGLFTRFDLADGAVDQIRESHAIHLGSGGRANVTAIPDVRFDDVCRVLAASLR